MLYKSMVTALAFGFSQNAFCQWEFSESVDPMTDSKIQVVSAMAEGESPRYRPKSMFVRCKNGKLDVIMLWSAYLGDNRRMLVRFDKLDPDSQVWSSSADKTGLFSQDPSAFVDMLKKHTTLAAQVTPYSKSPVTVVYDLKGFSEKAAKLDPSCK